MRRLVFHIGFHKTGTTQLQRTLLPAISGVDLVPRDLIRDELLNKQTLDYDPKLLRRALQPKRGRTLVASHEEMSGNPHTAGGGGFVPAEIARRIHASCPDASILITVRSQLAVIESWYRQYVKEGGHLTLSALLDSDTDWNYRFPRFQARHFEYHRLALHYIGLFGAERVHILTQESMTQEPENFLRELLLVLGSKLDETASLLPCMMQRDNPGMSAAAIVALRRFNRVAGRGPGKPRNNARIFRAISGRVRRLDLQLPGYSRRKSRPILSPALQKQLFELYRASNDILQGMTKADLARLGYPMSDAHRHASAESQPPLPC